MKFVLFISSSAIFASAFTGRNYGGGFRIGSPFSFQGSGSASTKLHNSYFSIDTTENGPSDGKVHTLTIHNLPGQEQEDGEIKEEPIVIETGKIGRQAAGAVTVTRGDTVLYATAARDDEPKEGLDFLPLSVEHQERFSSAGLTSGSYNKRDGRPAEHEILVCRLIDRPLRPLVASGWRHETQLLSWVLSYDGVRSCDPLAITSSATALYLSDIPLLKPVSAVMVGYDEENDKLILNPTNKQMDMSSLQLVVAGTKDAILMIEGAADFLPEETMLKAVKFGHDAIKATCEAVEAFGEHIGITKKMDTIKPPVEGLKERVDELMLERVDDVYEGGGTKITQGPKFSALKTELLETLEEEFPGEELEIKGAFKDLLCSRMFERAKAKQVRCDNRQLDEIRRLDMEAGLLPRVHGSALFTRGDTQCLASATLGGSGMKQKIDKLDGLQEKRFYLQYTFPPSCVGETGRVGMPGRREVGHGNLAERALIPSLPTEAEFPYSIRVESLITESHGSSSMASVCGGSLALMDAGVPVKSPVAGIAMGMLLGDKGSVADEDAIILSDILGTEDALGTMDFKVAGDRKGITTFQLDIKCEGLSFQTMERALEQARKGRLHILDHMDQVLDKPRDSLPKTVPKMNSFNVTVDSIGKIIGPGGKQIRTIIEDFELESMDISEEGLVQIASFNDEKMKEAEEFVKLLVGGGPKRQREPKVPYGGPEPEEGKIYSGPIKGIHQFGVFVEILPGAEDGSYPGLEGLCHISELDTQKIRNCEGWMKSMGFEELEVMYLGKQDNGKIRLSRKAVQEQKSGKSPKRQFPQKKEESSEPPTASMSEEELDVIAKAIEGANEM